MRSAPFRRLDRLALLDLLAALLEALGLQDQRVRLAQPQQWRDQLDLREQQVPQAIRDPRALLLQLRDPRDQRDPLALVLLALLAGLALAALPAQLALQGPRALELLDQPAQLEQRD